MSVPAASREKPACPIGSVDSAMRLLLMLGEHGHVRVADAAAELGVGQRGGRAMLSTLAERDLIELYPSARLPQHPRSSLRLRSELFAQLGIAREFGFAVQRNESEAGVSAVAALGF